MIIWLGYMSGKKKADKPLWHVSYTISLLLLWIFTWLAHLELKTFYYKLPNEVFWIETILATLLLILMIVSIWRKNMTTIWWEAILFLVSFAGVWILALALLPFWLAIIFAALATLIVYFWQNTMVGNLFFFAGALGIGLLGTWHFSSTVILAVGAGVLLYDIYRSREIAMATLFYEARKTGLAPSVVIPVKFSYWFKDRSKVWLPGKGRIVGFLPLAVLAALGFHVLLGFGYAHFIILVIFVMVAGLLLGLDEKYNLREWVYLGSALLAFALMKVIDSI